MTMLVRLFTIAMPAFLVYAAISTMDSDIALIFLFGMFYLGFEVTKPDPKRGEKFLA